MCTVTLSLSRVLLFSLSISNRIPHSHARSLFLSPPRRLRPARSPLQDQSRRRRRRCVCCAPPLVLSFFISNRIPHSHARSLFLSPPRRLRLAPSLLQEQSLLAHDLQGRSHQGRAQLVLSQHRLRQRSHSLREKAPSRWAQSLGRTQQRRSIKR